MSAQIDEDVIREKSARIDNNCRVLYQMISVKIKNTVSRSVQSCSNVENSTLTLRVGAVTFKINILHIKPYNMVNAE